MINPSRINVLFVASEADPLIKVGGLGDIAGSLPRALMTVGSSSKLLPAELDVRLVIPYHPSIRRDLYPSEQVAEYRVHNVNNEIFARAFTLQLHGLPVYLISGAPIEQESGVYSSNLEADGFKYVFFSQAALNLSKKLDWRPDILHANDWHTSAAVYSLALNRLMDPFFRQTSSLLTVHNLPYLGSMTSSALEAFDLPPAENTSLPAWAGHMALPLGLLTADAIVAVSQGYAKEIMTDEFGSGLQSFLRAHSNKITGILNGLDTLKWDPTNDIELANNFSPANLQARVVNKSFLQNELGLDTNPTIPLLSMVTRMDPQKGVDLAVDSLRLIFQSNLMNSAPLQAVFLGTGDPILEQAVRNLESDYLDRVRARIIYNEKLSRQIYAGADMLLMPSRYEPCGLSQMIAMHYGCLPIARATGGLSDTIQDPTETDQSTGFLFKPPTPEALAGAIQRALTVYTLDPLSWQAMQIRAMQKDFSWDRSAMEYIKQYKILLDKQREHKIDMEKYV
jgi:starch synthase